MYHHKNGILLRPIEERDLDLLQRLKNESWFGTHTIAIINQYSQLEWFKKISMSDSAYYMLATLADTGVPVGLYKITNIDWISRNYDSAHDVFPEQRGKGYGKTVLEAGVDFGFEVLNMHRINTEVLENNQASLSCAMYVGYQKEGVRRKAVFKCQEYLDSIVLGILYDDWKNLDRVKNYGAVCNNSYKPKNSK